ncbi:LytR C-terminal domain-containing protein [Dietzia sp. B32]|uniref:LytR C-terminal domain-containing protein n=1 Tax=Dietzia sp. B32 TaxID=2915130 RepID=UPI0021AE1BD7|nr:LytR C-terminal domain-containing protein [Dietzia sp. B32]UVE96596.1 LytR C-terminal domain-containing protein [Dietzia sp. B32]
MSSQSGNPQYDSPQPGDAEYGDPEYGNAHGADDPHGPGDGPGMDEPTGPPYRAIAMVLLAAVVLAVGVGLVQLFGSDDDSAPTADDTTSQVEQDGQGGQDADGGTGADGADGATAPGDGGAGQDGRVGDGDGTTGGGADGRDPQAADPAVPGQGQPAGQVLGGAGPDVTSVPVQIFNNSTVTGLAGRTGEALRENGYAVGDVANMPSNRGVVAESTAFYGTGPGEQQAAQAIAAQLGITAKPRPADLAGEAPGVIVIVTQDLDR